MLYDKSYIEFYNGRRMPIVGLGTWQGRDDEVKNAVKIALETGYRHIDTAFAYQNEKIIGQAMKEVFSKGKIRREDVFVVTKLPTNAMRASDVKRFMKMSLENLQLDYVDLYLVHSAVGFENVNDTDSFPRDATGKYLIDFNTDLVGIWQAMEQMVHLGLAKSIGVSNWATTQLERIMKNCKIKPANVQVECNIYMQQNYLHDYCIRNGITICAYAPIGSPGFPAFVEKMMGAKIQIPSLMSDPVIVSLAEKYKKEPAQILLRFLMQRGIAVIPKSVTPKRIKSNFDVFNFALTVDEMKAIKALDKRMRVFALSHITGIENHSEYRAILDEDEKIKHSS
ncbi:hypothetical protein CHUAL_010261 [Chamberlinius hualienensis]